MSQSPWTASADAKESRRGVSILPGLATGPFRPVLRDLKVPESAPTSPSGTWAAGGGLLHVALKMEFGRGEAALRILGKTQTVRAIFPRGAAPAPKLQQSARRAWHAHLQMPRAHPDPVALVLASRSPRRPVLLRYLTDDFVVDAVPVDEVAPRSLGVGDALELIARKKALATSASHPDAYVLAADTVVAFGDELVGKARDELTLRRQLAMLSGMTHQVWTGLALAWRGQAVDAAHAVTAVHMDRLPIAVLDTYAASGQWQGKAGGYGIQDPLMAPFLDIKAGPRINVVGLPFALERDVLRRNGIATRDPPTEEWLRDHNPFEPTPGSALTP